MLFRCKKEVNGIWKWLLHERKTMPPASSIQWFPSCTVCCLNFLHICTTFLANTVNGNKGSNNNSENLRSELEISNRTEVAGKLSITYKTINHKHFFPIRINAYGIAPRSVYFSMTHDWFGVCVFDSVLISISKYFD